MDGEATMTKEEILKSFDEAFEQKITPKVLLLEDVINKAKALYSVDKGPVKEAVVEAAKLEDAGGMIAGVTKTEVFGLPIGQAAAGGVVAVIAGELVDMAVERFMPAGGTWVAGATKAAAAWLASSKWVTNIIGKPAGTAAAILLTYDAIRTFIPFDAWIRARIPGSNPLEFGARGMTGGALNQAEKVATGYYSKMLGG